MRVVHAWGISSNSQLPVADSAAGSCPGQWNRILQMSDEMVAQVLQDTLVGGFNPSKQILVQLGILPQIGVKTKQI